MGKTKKIVSRGMGLFTIAHCLRSGTIFAGGKGTPDWTPPGTSENRAQLNLSDMLPSIYPDLQHFNEKELIGVARDTAEEINTWLEEHGSPLRLDPWPNDGNGMEMASILDVTVEWPAVCNTSPVFLDNKKKDCRPGFVAKDINGFRGTLQSGHSEPIARLITKNGDLVFLTRWDKALDDQDVPYVIADIRKDLRPDTVGYTGVSIPMIDLTLEPDISWTIDLSTVLKSGEWRIVQAKQRIRFGMNQFGARAREETAMGARSFSPMSKLLELNGPFLCWFERPRVCLPYVTLLCAPDCFKDPGDLAKMA